MGDAPRLPVIDPERLARASLDRALAAAPGEARVRVTAEQVRWLSEKRRRLALGSMPLTALVGIGAVILAPELALVAVLCGFFEYAAIAVAGRQRTVAREAADFEVVLRGDRIELPGQAPRTVLRAINRPDYLRLLSSAAWVDALRLDNRLDPSAFFDLAASAEDRRALGEHLRAAGVRVTTEGDVRRVVLFAGSFAATLLGLAAARSVATLTALAVVTAPLTLGVVGTLVVLAWLSGRRRA